MKNLLMALLLLTLTQFVLAQDVITLNNGEEIKTHIINYSKEKVVVCPPGAGDTVVYSRDQIAKIHYQNGTVILLNEAVPATKSIGTVDENMYMRGVTDANKYYQKYRTAATWSAVSGTMFFYGLAVPIACSLKAPAMQNLGYPDATLMNDRSYSLGYINQAHKIKSRKVWRNYGIAAGSMMAVGFLGLMLMFSVANGI